MPPWWWPFGRVPEVAPHDLAAELRATSPQLVDIRQPVEYQGGHIAGAVNVPLPSLKSALPSLALDREKPVVVICLSGHRSVPAARLLLQQGYDVRQLAGGMLAWRAVKLPEER